MRLRATLLALLAGVPQIGTAQAAPDIAFDTGDGDAWTFRMQVSGHASKDCETVIVRSPLGVSAAVRLDERFFATVPLQSGHNRIEAICRRDGRDAARTAPQSWRVPLADVPTAWVRIRTSGMDVHLDAGGSEPAPARAAPIVSYEWWARAGNPAALHLIEGETLAWDASTPGERLALAAPSQDGEYYVVLRIADALGRVDYSTAVFRVEDGRVRTVDSRTEHPAWVDAAILYGAAPYFFQPSSFRGIEQRLDEIAALGATAIWLSPVNAAAPGDFGYAVVDHFALRGQFGTPDELRSLIDTAHRLGLRVLVDFVPNHLSDRSAYALSAARGGRRSPYYDWFDRDIRGTITHYFDWTHLENLDYDNPQVRNYVIAAFARFVRDYDVDGFRIDASWAVAQRSPEFWPRLRAELKRIDPDLFLLAEDSALDAYPFANGFDAAYDWSRNPGVWAWRGVFGDDGSVDLDRLRRALAGTEAGGFPPDSLILRFINNNDTGERFAVRYGRPMARLAATLIFTVPGLPLIYMGDETGAAFEPYDEGPPIRWNDDDPLAAHYRELSRLRRTHAALRTRTMQILHTNRDEDVLAFLRPGETPSQDILVLLNFSTRDVDVGPGAALAETAFARLRHATDLLSGKTVALSPRRLVHIEAESALLLASNSARSSPSRAK